MPTQLKVRFGVDPKAPCLTDPKTGKPKYYAFYWPGSDQKRSEILSVKRGDPATFESTYQGRPGAREGSIFLESDFIYIDPIEDIQLGAVNPHLKEFMLKTKAQGIFQAWDTAYEETKQSAWTVCITGLFVPCNKYHRNEDVRIYGPPDDHFDVYILDVYREKKDFADVIMAIRSQYAKWKPEEVIIENKASGISAIQIMQRANDIPVFPVPAEQGKRARAINGVGAGSAQGWFRLNRVIFPSSAPWLNTYTTEMKDFSGAEDAVSDQVDATVHLIRRAIVLGAQTTLLPSDWTPERGTPIDIALGLEGMQAQSNTALGDRGMFLTMLGELPNMSSDPFYGLCGRCQNYQSGSFCKIHQVRKAAMDSCILYEDKTL